MDDLKNKVFFVTGGASGIGAATCKIISEKGGRVAVLDLNEKASITFAETLNAARGYGVDVTDPHAMEAVVAQVVEDFGPLNGAVNSAGIGGGFGPAHVLPLDIWNQTLAVNLSGVHYSMRAAIPHLIAAGGGSIVNMASMAGLVAEGGMPAYIASKHGVVGLTKAAAIDYGENQIRCNAVCPAFVKTPMTADIPIPGFWDKINESQPLGRSVTAEEVAYTTVFLLSDRSAGLNGSVHRLDGGSSAGIKFL